MEVVVSPETTKSILEDGLRMAVDEICLPVKTFHGHIKYLIDKVERLARSARPYEVEKGETVRFLNEALRMIYNAKSLKEVKGEKSKLRGLRSHI